MAVDSYRPTGGSGYYSQPSYGYGGYSQPSYGYNGGYGGGNPLSGVWNFVGDGARMVGGFVNGALGIGMGAVNFVGQVASGAVNLAAGALNGAINIGTGAVNFVGSTLQGAVNWALRLFN